jgi:adenylate cyclase
MDDFAEDQFRQLLEQEILRNERRRVLGQAGLLAVILLATTLTQLVAPGFVDTVFQTRVPLWLPIAVLGPMISYELIVAHVTRLRTKWGRAFPVLARFANAAVEISFPTVFIFFLERVVPPDVAFSDWPSLLYFLMIGLSTLRLDFVLSAFTGVVAAVELFTLAAFQLHLAWRSDDIPHTIAFHLARSLVLVVAGLVAGLVGLLVRRHFEGAMAAASTRDRVVNLFGQHVSPQVVDRLLALGASEAGEMRQVCVMFVDIRNFTAAARERSPTEVVARLDEAFAVLVEIVDRHQGIVNKFLGDGLLAMFGAPIDDPDAAAHAVAAGREMLAAMAGANQASVWPLHIGIGVHFGEAVTGTVGSPRRKEYTVIGDTVNLASRLESLNKEFGTQFLVSGAVRAAAATVMEDSELLGAVEVRGYARQVEVWRVA